MDQINEPQILRLAIYVAGLILALLMAILGFIAKYAISSVLTKMDEFLEEVRKLTDKATKQETEIGDLKDEKKEHLRRLNEHGSKIQTLDVKISSCQAKHQANVAV